MSIYDLAVELVWNLFRDGASWDGAVTAAANQFDLSTAEENRLYEEFDK